MLRKMLLLIGVLLAWLGPPAALRGPTCQAQPLAALPDAARTAPTTKLLLSSRPPCCMPSWGWAAAGLSLAVFREGLVGYYNLRPAGNQRRAARAHPHRL